MHGQYCCPQLYAHTLQFSVAWPGTLFWLVLTWLSMKNGVLMFMLVLLPSSDLQVTDTTTFTDERRRADVDAWLYETCTQCLQHIVDLVVKFYPVVQDLLPRILELLQGFVRRPHHSLAAVGVAGLVRLIINAGISFSEATWSEVLMGVGAMAADTLPALGEVCYSCYRTNTLHRLRSCCVA